MKRNMPMEWVEWWSAQEEPVSYYMEASLKTNVKRILLLSEKVESSWWQQMLQEEVWTCKLSLFDTINDDLPVFVTP
jgi:hypothetical protein